MTKKEAHVKLRTKSFCKNIYPLKKMVGIGIFLICYSCTLVSAGAGSAYKQTIQENPIRVTGNIVDDEGNIISGASIRVRGTNNGTTSGERGDFTLSNVPTTSGLDVSALGSVGMSMSFARADNGDYSVHVANEEYQVNVRSSFDLRSRELKLTIILPKEATMLDETVVIGYQTVKRSDLTGAVSSINAEQLKDVPINSAEQALAGRLAGVQVTSSEGGPGSDVKIIVRGGTSITQSSEPLYIIDGIMVETGLMGIHPSDIESIDVLKDAASTAIYGARGANGVVLVTTKGGKIMKTRVEYDGFYGQGKISKKLPVMDAYNFVLRQYETTRGNLGDQQRFLTDYGEWADLGRYKDVEGIDWQDRIFGRNAGMQTHIVRVIGGTRQTRFNIGFTSNDEDGIMINSEFSRKQFNVRFNHDTGNKLKISFNLRYMNQLIDGAGVSQGDRPLVYNNMLRHTIKYRPIPGQQEDDNWEELLDEDYFSETNNSSLGILHPVLLSNGQPRQRKNNYLNLGGYLEYAFTEGLTGRSTLGFSSNKGISDRFEDVITPTSRLIGAGMPLVFANTNGHQGFNFSNTLNYKKNFGSDHKFDVLVGQEYYAVQTESTTNQLIKFPVGITAEKAWAQWGLAESVSGYPRSNMTESKLFSFFSTANYSFKSKYLFTANLRADGSSKFPSENRWGYFPSGAFAWRFSDESFMRDFLVVSNAKLRLSYGMAGNNRIQDYLYMTNFSPTVRYSLDEADQIGFVPTSLANKELTWENTYSTNVGLDFSLFRNRLSFVIDAYRNYTKDLLVAVPIPSSSGYVTQLQNVGNTSSQGLEIQMVSTVIKKRDFSWTSNFNIAFNRNKVEKLASGMDHFLANPPAATFVSGQAADYIVKVGEPVGAMYGFVEDGFYSVYDFDYDYDTQIYTLKDNVVDVSTAIGTPQPGWMKLKDLNKDGIIDENDKAITGYGIPKFSGGWNQQFAFKNFDLSVFVNFVYGNSIYNANKMEFTNGFTRFTNMLAVMEDRWKTMDDNGNIVQQFVTVGGERVLRGVSPEELAEVNREAKIWMPISGTGQFQPTSWHIEDGSYLRINNITLGYTFPKRIVNLLKAKDFRIYGTVNNLHIFTNYTGYDPDVDARASRIITPGVDYSAYPRSRTYVVGVSLKL